jgi:hypothetical protein
VILEDFVMLGTTVHEPSSKYGLSVCSAGWSAELGQLVRIYPLARWGAPRRWSINRVRLERNTGDARTESWSIAGRDPQHHATINDAFVQVGEVRPGQRAGLLDKCVIASISEANKRRLSLAVIQPTSEPSLVFEHNPDSPDSPELRLFDVADRPIAGSKRFAFIPRVEFNDAAGTHRLQLRDWGSYERLRKGGDARRHELSGALHIGADSSLLVGNLNHQRNAWLVISVLNGLRDGQASLFPHPREAVAS